MPVPTAITDLSTTAALNSPPGSESIAGNMDDYVRAAFAFIAQLRTGIATFTTTSITGAFSVDSPTFVVDAANNRVGVGLATPAYGLDVWGATGGAAAINDVARVHANASSTATARLLFGSIANPEGGAIGVRALTATTAELILYMDSGGLVAGLTIQPDGVIYNKFAWELGFRDILRAGLPNAYTFVSTDRGLCYAGTPATGPTVPSGVFSGGAAISIYNDSASSFVITQGAGLVLRLAGTTLTGNRLLGARGFATVWFNTGTEAIISGGGVS